MKNEIEFLHELINLNSIDENSKIIILHRINELEGTYENKIKNYLRLGYIKINYGLNSEVPVSISMSKEVGIQINQEEIETLKDIFKNPEKYILICEK
jgi:hypothetical protein